MCEGRSILQATGVQLDDFVQLLRLTRNPATKTALEIAPATGTPNPLNLNGVAGTIIADASVVTLGDTGERFLISGPVTKSVKLSDKSVSPAPKVRFPLELT